jgi:hypothetical protein
MGNIVAKEKRAEVLKGWKNDQLHPNTVEALKRLDDAKHTYEHQLQMIDGQYLRSLGGLDADSAKQADAVRKLMR